MSLTKKLFSGVLWSAVDRFGVHGLRFLIMIFLARYLSPVEFGIMGIVNIFLSLCQLLSDSGFSTGLIRNLNRTETDFTTAFYSNIFISILLYISLFFSAPYIAIFYELPELILIIRTISIVVLITSFISINAVILSINIDYKKMAKITFIAAFISSIAALYTAYLGYGVWALVLQAILKSLIEAILYSYYVRWLPKESFSFESLKKQYSYGVNIVLDGIFDSIYHNAYFAVIGKVFSVSTLGYYTQAKTIAVFPSSFITSILGRVTYPVLSTIQKDDAKLLIAYQKLLNTTAFLVFPVLLIFTALAHPFIVAILGEKWINSILMLQILSLATMWYPIQSLNMSLLKVVGSSKLYFRIGVIRKLIGLIFLALTFSFGVEAICCGFLLTALFSIYINSYYTGKLINFGFLLQMKGLLFITIISFAVSGFIYYLSLFFLIDLPLLQLCVFYPLGILLYVVLAKLFRFPEYNELFILLKNMKKK